MPKHTRTIRRLLVILLVSSLLPIAPRVAANGWEHTSIDFEVLVSALDSDNPDLRRRAAESIGFRQQPGAADALLARLAQKEPAAPVRREIYASLGKLGDVKALPALADCIDAERDDAARVQCAGALGYIEHADAAKTARRALADTNLTVRVAAVTSLGSFDDTASLDKLVELSAHVDPRLRHTALLALGRTQAPAVAPVLTDALKNSSRRGQTLAALQGLTLLADPATAELIQAFYRGSDDAELRRYALVAMANSRARGSEAFFLDALDSDDYDSRLLGLAVLRNFGSAAETPAVARRGLDLAADIYGHGPGHLTRDPRQTISKLELLLAYLKTVVKLDPAVAERLYLSAAQPVALPRTQSAELKIADLLYQLRWQSIYGLGYCGSEAALRTIAAAAADADARIRAVATRSLGVFGAVEEQELLLQLLEDEAAEVRWMAARVLGRLESREPAPQLQRSLTDPHAQVRIEAALALGYLDDKSALKKLESLAQNDPDARVSDAARFAASLIE